MLGPLPMLYRSLLLVTSLLLGCLIGLIAGATPAVPVMMGSGALVGLACGGLLYLLLAHQRRRPDR